MSLNLPLVACGAHILCAVSGGADSMALLWSLWSMRKAHGLTVTAAHFNHRLRGEESERDEAFVRDFCGRHGIELTVGSADVNAYAHEHGKSVEEAARILRYEFLNSLPCDKLATAHNADDNAETVLLHLLRGSGLRGLCGISPVRGKLIRPLLQYSHEELVEYLRSEGIAWVEDSTNSCTDFTRNRLRREVMPLLKRENPNLLSAVTAQSMLLQQDDALLDSYAEELVCQAATDGQYRCDVIVNAPEALQKRALRLILHKHLPQDVSLVHIKAMQSLLTNPSPSAQISLPHGLTVRRCYDCFTVQTDCEPKSFPPTVLCIPGETILPSLNLKIVCKITKNLQIFANNPFHFAVKYDMIAQHEFIVRPRQSGDTLTLGCTKSLKKWFIERKIPAHERASALVFSCAEKVVAVPRLGVDRDFCPTDGQCALEISVEPLPNL